jgi:hypothetical protein
MQVVAIVVTELVVVLVVVTVVLIVVGSCSSRFMVLVTVMAIVVEVLFVSTIYLSTQVSKFCNCVEVVTGPSCPLSKWCSRLILRRLSERSMKQTTCLQQVQRSRIHGSIHSLRIRLYGVVLR